ncbi:unnamed protein product [Brachionus calyciflorus]|uniref:Polysaccharide biosynthesis domain-containing protein n=1 Tax=Brachionus calyciflorus TaxID=104777 RepID=A0A813M1C0_9BILA|nr:unnamed protein product [Brachionus calyciflorus]
MEEEKFQIDNDAQNYVNDPQIELQWAMKAFQHAEIHYNLLCAIDSKMLKLTKIDETIYAEFRQHFNELPVDKIDVDHLKSAESKEKWRPFCESYKEKVEDYNMGTLLRIDAYGDYNEENTTLVPRIQFYAIEIARNREGHNSAIKENFKKSSAQVEK